MKLYKRSHCIKMCIWFLIAILGFKMLLLAGPSSINFGYMDNRIRSPVRLLATDQIHGSTEIVPERSKEPFNGLQELQQLLDAHEMDKWSMNESCAPYPRFLDIHIENLFYQFALGGNVSYFLYSAYYDRRQTIEYSPCVVILAMIDRFHGPFPSTYCQVWYEDSGTPDIVPVVQQNIGWHSEWGDEPQYVFPMLLKCSLADSHRSERVPQLVSLVFGDGCARATNALRVIYNAPARKRATRFAVCVKDVQFPKTDVSQRLIEWLEMLKILGAERVTIYDLGGNTLQENTRRTLKHYELEDGFLRIRDHRLMEGHSQSADRDDAETKRHNEVLIYTDCYYRHMYEFDYIGIFDVDELIMPLGQFRNWSSLIDHLELNTTRYINCQRWASYCFRNIYFPPELPEDETPPAGFFMLRHVHRVAKHLDQYSAIKCLHSSQHIAILHNHFPVSWYGTCGYYDVPTSMGQLQHYRCPDVKATLKEPPPPRDDNIWRFKDQLIANVLAKQRQIGAPLP